MENPYSLSESHQGHRAGEPVENTESLLESFTSEYDDPLQGENYEKTSEVLERLEVLQRYRKELTGSFSSFYELVECVTKIRQSPVTDTIKGKKINQLVQAMQGRSAHFSPRVADIFQALLGRLGQESYEPRFEETRSQMAKLTHVEDQRCDLDVLFADDVSWDLKINRITNVLDGYLAGMRALDRREGKEMKPDVRRWREEQLKKASSEPPTTRNESKPGVDPMKRLKEGERATATWTISPAWGGLYKSQTFTEWDEETKSWKNAPPVYSDVPITPLSNNLDIKKGPIDITLSASIRPGEWYSIPSSYKHGFHTISAQGKEWQVKKNQQGDLVFWVTGMGDPMTVQVVFAPDARKTMTSREPGSVKIPHMPAEFSEETRSILREIKGSYRGNMAQAYAIRRYVLKRIAYLAPEDQQEAEYYNSIYRTSPKGFAGAVDEVKKGDCDVVNTYFAALCAQLKIPVRHATGDSVNAKDENGHAMIHDGSGHGWSEVWNERKCIWQDLDSTPPGDTNLEDHSSTSDSCPGYFGDKEAVSPSNEAIEELRKKLSEHKEKLSYTRSERDLSEATGVTLQEARQIVKEIAVAEDTRLPSGRKVVDVLAHLFNAIVEARKVVKEQYDGPVRKSEGGRRIEKIVRHIVSTKAGEQDPLTREIINEEEETEASFGGFDVYIIGDKSGSMSSSVDAEMLWQIQRRAEYLLFSSLHRFERAIERAAIPSEESLSVRTEGISFRGSADGQIDVDKPLSPKFAPADKVRLWHSLTNQGGGNGDVEALNLIYTQILDEQSADKKGTGKKRLRFVIACSDGGPDSPEDVHKYAEALGQLGVIVLGLGLTETARSVKDIYTTPFSRGDVVKDLNDLPIVIAKYVIEEAVRLFPAHARENAQVLINEVLAEFSRY